MQPRFLALEIGGTKLQVAAGDAAGGIIARERFPVDRARGGAGIRAQIAATLPALLAAHRPGALGVGFGGPVDTATGRICCSHQIDGWSEFPLGEWLGELSKLPVTVENDANTAALGEARRGAGRGFDPVFYVTLGSGVGGGLVVHGRVYHGAKPGESEIGHVRLDRAGTVLEHRCSGWAVDQKVRDAIAGDPQCLLAELALGEAGAEARWLVPALEQGDALAQRLLTETAEELAFGLSHVTHLFHPQIIVLGGGLSQLGEPLRAAVAGALPGFLMGAMKPGPLLALAALAEDAVPIGALLLAGELAARTSPA